MDTSKVFRVFRVFKVFTDTSKELVRLYSTDFTN